MCKFARTECLSYSLVSRTSSKLFFQPNCHPAGTLRFAPLMLSSFNEGEECLSDFFPFQVGNCGYIQTLWSRLERCKASRSHFTRPQYTAHSTPPTVHRPQYTAHSTPPTVHRPQYTTHSTPPTVHRPQYTAHSTPPTVHRPQYTAHSTPPTVLCSRSNDQLYTVLYCVTSLSRLRLHVAR